MLTADQRTEYVEYHDMLICVDWEDGYPHLTDMQGRVIYDDAFSEELRADRIAAVLANGVEEG